MVLIYWFSTVYAVPIAHKNVSAAFQSTSKSTFFLNFVFIIIIIMQNSCAIFSPEVLCKWHWHICDTRHCGTSHCFNTVPSSFSYINHTYGIRQRLFIIAHVTFNVPVPAAAECWLWVSRRGVLYSVLHLLQCRSLVRSGPWGKWWGTQTKEWKGRNTK